MKKLLTLLFAGVCAVGMMASASALTIELSDDDVNGYYLPGKTYTFPLYDGSYKLDSDYFKEYSIRIEVTEGKSYITRPSIKKLSGGAHALVFSVNPSKSYKDNVPVTIELISTYKEDRKDTDIADISFDVGYGGYGTCSDNEYTVNQDQPLVEFTDDMRGEVVTISFEDYGSIEYKHSGTRMTNFAFTTDTNEAVLNKNMDADMTFLHFYASPSLPSSGTLKVYAPGARYLYRVNDDNTLTRLNPSRDDDNLIVKTDRLTSYVASDIALKAVASESSSSTSPSSSSTTSNTTSSSSSSGGKVNPATGAIA